MDKRELGWYYLPAFIQLRQAMTAKERSELADFEAVYKGVLVKKLALELSVDKPKAISLEKCVLIKSGFQIRSRFSYFFATKSFLKREVPV